MANYWIFKTNPELYRIDERLVDPEPNATWRVTRYRDEIQKGDMAFIWRAGPPVRGICALMEIDSDPEYIDGLSFDAKYNIALRNETTWRVKGRLTNRFPVISSQMLKQVHGLENLSVFHGYQAATNFRVTTEEGQIIKIYINFHSRDLILNVEN